MLLNLIDTLGTTLIYIPLLYQQMKLTQLLRGFLSKYGVLPTLRAENSLRRTRSAPLPLPFP